MAPQSNSVAPDSNLFGLLFPPDRDRDKLAIRTPEGAAHTYGDLEAASARYANALRQLGVRPGDRVAVQTDKCVAGLELYLGVLRLGAVYLPLNPAYTRAELEYYLQDAEPTLIVTCFENENRTALAATVGTHHATLGPTGGSLVTKASTQPDYLDSVPCTRDDLAAILYTSGTTGRPKGAMISHGNLASNVRALQTRWAYQANDHLVHALPIFHTHGLFVACHLTFFTGASMTFLAHFDAGEVAQYMAGATVYMGVPTHYNRLLDEPTFTRAVASQLRVFISGSAPMPLALHKRFAAHTGQVVLERYGMTEIGMHLSNPFTGTRKPGTVGTPLPSCEVRIADDAGHILSRGQVGGVEVRGPNVFQGYWRRPEKTAEDFRADGFFRTGDLGYIDEDGYVTLVGRARDLIISGGLNVYPKEVETALEALPGVAEAAVIGLPHPDWGEEVVAVVVPGPAEQPERDLIAGLKTVLAPYKVPKRIFFRNDLPRNAMGKVQKSILREAYGT